MQGNAHSSPLLPAPLQSNKEGVELLMSAIEKAGYLDKVKVGMDVASSEFLTKDGKYDLDFKVRLVARGFGRVWCGCACGMH